MKYNPIWLYNIAASVDILGQKQALKNIREVPFDEESKRKAVKIYKDAIIPLEKFRESFGVINVNYYFALAAIKIPVFLDI